MPKSSAVCDAGHDPEGRERWGILTRCWGEEAHSPIAEAEEGCSRTGSAVDVDPVPGIGSTT